MSSAKPEQQAEQKNDVEKTSENEAAENKDQTAAESSEEPQPMINEKALLAYDLQVDDQAYGVIERDANEIM